MDEREALLKKIKTADNMYYDNGFSIMSDAEYDALRNEYIEQYGSEDLDYVPGNAVSDTRFKHPVEVSSLGKVDETDMAKFAAELKRLAPVIVEPKYDGLTVVAYPDTKTGKYFFVTRGSGFEGDILPYFIGEYERLPVKENNRFPIRGEAYMTRKNFDKMNEVLISRGETPKKNPRNAAAGILNAKAKERHEFMDYLTFVCYDVIGMDSPETTKLDWIATTGFAKTDFCKIEEGVDFKTGIQKVMDNYRTLIEEDNIPIDGMVLKTDQDRSLERWGSTNHHNKNAVAIKAGQTAQFTTLTGIHWQLGKTGALTPVADFEPIEILGSTVSQASLSNPEEIKRLELRIGDRIGVIKAREIIPKIILNHKGGSEDIEIPKFCPNCRQLLSRKGPVLYCTNEFCSEKIAQQMAFLATKEVLDVEGLSIETCRKIVDKFGILYPDLVFGISKKDLLMIDGFAEKSAQKLADNLAKRRETAIDLERFLPALLIEGVGRDIAKRIKAHFKEHSKFMDAFLLCDEEEFLSTDGVGEATVEALMSDECTRSYRRLSRIFGIKPFSVQERSEGKYSGKTFVLTGKMPKKRGEYVSVIESLGGKVTESVSKNTDYLVIADVNSTSAKAEKARKLGIKLLAPEDVLA